MLNELDELIKRLNSTNKTNEKKFILEKCKNDETIKRIFEYTYNPYKIFGITSTNILKYYKTNFTPDSFFNETNLFNILDKLLSREYTGHRALNLVCNFIEKNKDFQSMILNIIDKDLECRCGVSIINDVFGGLIPEFKVALAEPLKDFMKHFSNPDNEFYAALKLDGARLITILKDGEIKTYSRSGIEFTTLDVIKKEVLKIARANRLDNIVLDGEACIVDEDGVENFKLIMKEITKKNHTIKNPKYFVFDYLTYDEFMGKVKSPNLMTRYTRLDKFDNKSDYLTLVKQISVKDIDLDQLLEDTISKGGEGLILRNNVPYEGKRTKNLLKMKIFMDGEFTVKDMIIGNIRIINKDTGLEETIETMTAVTIDYKGGEVDVGSGFSIAERKFYYLNSSQIVGKVITVQHFGETTNERGGLSLRFPTFKINHGLNRIT